jgi:tetratricopeptide (TPR) repeat protein
MRHELGKEEIEGHVRAWYDFIWRNGERPTYLALVDQNTPVAILGLTFHGLLYVAFRLSWKCRLWRLAGSWARVRLATDSIAFEPVQCGLSAAYNRLGLTLLKRGRIDEAIHCLDNAWRVYPCPHNTSYGLPMGLYKALEVYPEAGKVVDTYGEMNDLFKSGPSSQEVRTP